MQWDPGDGNDILEGQDGRDKLLFNTSNIGERIDVAANGGRVRLVRDIGNVTMDLDDVEEIDHRSFGGNDSVTVNDLSGTDADRVRRGPRGVRRRGRCRRRQRDRQRDRRAPTSRS